MSRLPALPSSLAIALVLIAAPLAAADPQAEPALASSAQPPAPSPLIGCIDLGYISSNSAVGKAAAARLRERSQQAESELATRAKALQAQQAAIEQGTAKAVDVRDLQRAFEKGRLEFTRFQQDAEAELNAFAEALDQELRDKLFPVVDTVSRERGLHFVFTSDSPGLIWFSAAVDLSDEVVKRMNAAP